MIRMQNLDGTTTWIASSAVSTIVQAGTNSTIKLSNGDIFNLTEAADIVAGRVAQGAQLVASGMPTPPLGMPILTRRA